MTVYPSSPPPPHPPHRTLRIAPALGGYPSEKKYPTAHNGSGANNMLPK